MSQSTNTIRNATTADAADILAIERSATAKFTSIPELADLVSDLEPVTASPKTIADWLEKGRVWVAQNDDDGKAVGIIAAIPKDKVLYVSELSVDLDHNGKGLGSKLLDVVFEWAREKAREGCGKAKVSLTTYVEVPWNGPWYRKRGFQEVSAATIGPEHVAKMKNDEEVRKLVRPGYRRCCMLWEDK